MGEFHLPRGAKTISELETRIDRVLAAIESRQRKMQGLDGSTVQLYGPVETNGNPITQGGSSNESYLTRADAIANAMYVGPGGTHLASRPVEGPIFRSASKASRSSDLVRYDQLAELQETFESNKDETDESLGTASTTASTRHVHLPFRSPAAAFGTYYFGGHYLLGAPDSNFGAPVLMGTANSSYGARVFFVASGAPGTPVSLTITGASIADDGTRVGGDTEVVIVPVTAAAGSMYQSAKRWVGQVSVSRTAGPALLCNWGLAAFEDNGAADFTVLGITASWLAGATDAGADLRPG